MDLVFLSSSKPIIKSYELDPKGNLTKHSYPFVYEVTSIPESPKNLSDFTNLLHKYAKQGACLLKGKLARPLVNESRRGSTDAEERTDWICLDLDGIENFQSVDMFLADIGCGDIDYVLQWSSSMNIENNTGFRCHIFMLLDKLHHPQLLKYWLMDLNMKVPALVNQLSLTKTGNSLRWPLDVTTCQNDKLLYIAPPHLGPGIKDPFPGKNRITFVAKAQRTLTLPANIPSKDTLRQKVDDHVTRLRNQANLPKRKASKYKFTGTVEYLVSPDSAVITDTKNERGFTYFNLNGGDSWAYYHPDDNPEFIFNFKGEPIYRTQDLLPEYWASLQQQASQCTPNSKGLIHLAFRDFRTSNYYNGIFDTNTNQLTFAMAKSESQLRQFMRLHGQMIGECVPDWDIVWEPKSPVIVDPVNKRLNTYQPSSFYLNTKPPKPPKSIPATIFKVIDHVLDHDPITIDHFVNWLAVIVQELTATGTAWVLQGKEGTGKGVLFHRIITPLFGHDNVVAKRMQELESEFTGYMENKFVVFVDEIETGESLYHGKIDAKLRNLIVEPFLSIRRMYQPPYMAPNYSNMIFASNKTAVKVPPGDRRYNVGGFQQKPLIISAHEIDILIPQELEAFFAYLKAYKADTQRARKPLNNAARDQLISINRSSIDTVSDAILAGNIEFLWDHLPAKATSITPLANFRYQPFRSLMIDIIQNKTDKLSRDDLFVIFDWCIGNMPQSPHKFAALLKHHNMQLTQIWKDGRNVRGLTSPWKFDSTWHANAITEITNGVI